MNSYWHDTATEWKTTADVFMMKSQNKVGKHSIGAAPWYAYSALTYQTVQLDHLSV